MKTAVLIVIATLLIGESLSAQTSTPPRWSGYNYPSISFLPLDYHPVLSSPPPTVIDTTMLYFSFSGIEGGYVSFAEVKGDSFIIEVGSGINMDAKVSPDYTSAGYKFVFDKAMVYKAYLRQNVECFAAPCPPILTYLGDFRILPKITTTPSPLLAGDSAKVQLLIAFKYYEHTSVECFPMYDTKVRIEDSLIYLSYIQQDYQNCLYLALPDPNSGLELPSFLKSYKPSFDLGILPAGTYQLMIEDSIKAGTITVYNVINVSGYARPMSNPMLDYMPPPIPDARIFATLAPQCPNPWGYRTDKPVIDTIWTTTGSEGRFSLVIPNTGDEFEVTAQAKGYLPQTVFTGNYALSKSNPPQMFLSYELIPEGGKDSVNLVAKVTNHGVPVESVSVSLSGGRELLPCPMYLAKSSYAGSYTGKDGTILLTGLALSPYIDYVWSAYDYKNGLSKSGLVRLNSFLDPDTLLIEFNGTPVEKQIAFPLAGQILVLPNPCNKPSIKLSFINPGQSARLMIYDINGRRVADFRNIKDNSVNWNAGNLGSGVYIVKAAIGKTMLTRTLLLQK